MAKIEDIIFGGDVKYFYNTPFLIRVTAEEAEKLASDFTNLLLSLFMQFTKKVFAELKLEELDDALDDIDSWFERSKRFESSRLGIFPREELVLSIDEFFLIALFPYAEVRPSRSIDPLDQSITLGLQIAEWCGVKVDELSFLASLSFRSARQFERYFLSQNLLRSNILTPMLDDPNIEKTIQAAISNPKDKKLVTDAKRILLNYIINEIIPSNSKSQIVFINRLLFSEKQFTSQKLSIEWKTVTKIKHHFKGNPNIEILTFKQFYDGSIKEKSNFEKQWDVLKRQTIFKFMLQKSDLIASFAVTRLGEAFKYLQEAKLSVFNAMETKSKAKSKRLCSSAIKLTGNALNSLLILVYSLENKMIPPGNWSLAAPSTLGRLKKDVKGYLSKFATLNKALDQLVKLRNKCEHPEALDDALTIPIDVDDALGGLKNVETLYEIVRQRVIDEKYIEGPYEDLIQSLL